MSDEIDFIPHGFYLRDGQPMVSWWLAFDILHQRGKITILGLACSDCSNLAEYRIWWPGAEDALGRAKCQAHAEYWAKVADAMGVGLPTQPIALSDEARLAAIEWHRERRVREDEAKRRGLDDAGQRFAAMELD